MDIGEFLHSLNGKPLTMLELELYNRLVSSLDTLEDMVEIIEHLEQKLGAGETMQ